MFCRETLSTVYFIIYCNLFILFYFSLIVAREADGKENVKTVPLRSFSPVLNSRRTNSPSNVTQPLSPTVEVKSPQLTRKVR